MLAPAQQAQAHPADRSAKRTVSLVPTCGVFGVAAKLLARYLCLAVPRPLTEVEAEERRREYALAVKKLKQELQVRIAEVTVESRTIVERRGTEELDASEKSRVARLFTKRKGYEAALITACRISELLDAVNDGAETRDYAIELASLAREAERLVPTGNYDKVVDTVSGALEKMDEKASDLATVNQELLDALTSTQEGMLVASDVEVDEFIQEFRQRPPQAQQSDRNPRQLVMYPPVPTAAPAATTRKKDDRNRRALAQFAT